jgi:hypothetical protein
MRFPLAVIGGVIGFVIVGNCTPQKPLSPGYPPPGRLIDIGGRSCIYTLGQGKSNRHPGG